MQSNFRMVMRSGPSVGKVYPLDKGEMFVGRDLSNDIVINDPEISRRHARLFQQGNGYVLEDLGSTNGSFVNGQRLVGPNILRPGDSITFGERMSMVFESSDYDQDATMISPASRPAYGAPPPQPGQGQAQVYDSGQASYNQPAQQPAYNPPLPRRRRSRAARQLTLRASQSTSLPVRCLPPTRLKWSCQNAVSRQCGLCWAFCCC